MRPRDRIPRACASGWEPQSSWSWCPCQITRAVNSSGALRIRARGFFDIRDLIDPPLMPASGERGFEPERQDFIGQRRRDDTASQRKHVGVVVLARQAGGERIIAQRGADPWNLVRGHLLSLTAPSNDDAAVGSA